MINSMRTTLTLDPDVELLLKEAMRQRDASFKEVVNSALRRGLRADRAQPPPKFVQQAYDMGPLLVGTTNLNALATELEDQELIAKLQRGA
jgi:hypothetical protein